MNKKNCALKLVDEISLYYDARSKKHQNTRLFESFVITYVPQILALKIIHCAWDRPTSSAAP